MSVRGAPRRRRLRIDRDWVAARPWAWSFAAAAAVWVAAFVASHRGFAETLTSGTQIASLLVIVGIGQMFVITAGNGNIDLSIPSTMTLAAYWALGLQRGGDGGLVPGLLLGLAVGLVVALVNVFTILVLRIPPIVATLSVGFMAQSAAFVKSNNFSYGPSPSLARFVNLQFAGVPVMGLLSATLAAAAAVVLSRTAYGRSLQAVGQSVRAARLSGISVPRTLLTTYAISGVLAGLAGVLLAAASGGVQLDIATPYLLNSVAVVVLGGSLIQGGRSNTPGVWWAALFLSLLVTLLTVLHVNSAWQNVIKGTLIIGVLTLASARRDR